MIKVGIFLISKVREKVQIKNLFFTHSIQVGEDCFNGIGSYEGRRLDSTSIAKLTLKNNGMLQEMKIPAGSFTQIKNIEMSNLQP